MFCIQTIQYVGTDHLTFKYGFGKFSPTPITSQKLLFHTKQKSEIFSWNIDIFLQILSKILVTNCKDQVWIQDFKIGGALKFILGVFRVKNHDFTPKKSYFFNFRGGARALCAPWIRPWIWPRICYVIYIEYDQVYVPLWSLNMTTDMFCNLFTLNMTMITPHSLGRQWWSLQYVCL